MEEASQHRLHNYYLFYDTETTSNTATKDDIISLGAVLTEYNYNTRQFDTIDQFHSYVFTRRRIDPAAQNIHHISPQMIQGQPTFPEAISAFRLWIKKYKKDSVRMFLVAHNGRRFDDIILYCNFIKHKMDCEEFFNDINIQGFVDTLPLIKDLSKTMDQHELPRDPETGKVSFALGVLYRSWCGGGELEGAHDALVDSEALVKVMNTDKVTSRLNVSMMFRKYIVRMDKGTKWIKQQAGQSFQQQEAYIRRQGLGHSDTSAPMEVDLDGKVQVVDQSLGFEDYTGEEMGAKQRLCLNCMCFVLLTHNHQCQVDPQAFVVAQSKRNIRQRQAEGITTAYNLGLSGTGSVHNDPRLFQWLSYTLANRDLPE